MGAVGRTKYGLVTGNVPTVARMYSPQSPPVSNAAHPSRVAVVVATVDVTEMTVVVTEVIVVVTVATVVVTEAIVVVTVVIVGNADIKCLHQCSGSDIYNSLIFVRRCRGYRSDMHVILSTN